MGGFRSANIAPPERLLFSFTVEPQQLASLRIGNRKYHKDLLGRFFLAFRKDEDAMTYNPLEHVEFTDNPEPRCPVILLLDISGSMSGSPIAELNEGLRAFEQTLKADRLASLRVEVAVITFGGTPTVVNGRSGGAISMPFDANQAFVTVDQFTAPTLTTRGDTPMGGAARQMLPLLRDRKQIYRQNGIDFFRPWVFMITDGGPTDTGWEAAADQVREEEDRKGLNFFAVGVQSADMTTLARFCKRNQPLKLKGLAFRDLFQWLSNSLSAVSQSQPGEQVALPAVGWAVA